MAQFRFQAAIDDMSAFQSAGTEPTAKETAEHVLQHARAEAVRTGTHRVVTAAEPGLEVVYAEELRNERVPVAFVSPRNSEDWGDTYAPFRIMILMRPCLVRLALSCLPAMHMLLRLDRVTSEFLCLTLGDVIEKCFFQPDVSHSTACNSCTWSTCFQCSPYH